MPPRRESPPAARAAALATGLPAGLVAWRIARSGYWSARLQGRIPVHARYWTALAERDGDPLYVAVGDSTAQGLGARDPAGSYVGQLERRLPGRLRVVNLSVCGARLGDVISALLPRLAALDTDRALVTFAAGANDIIDFDADRFTAELAVICDALPRHALLAELPSFYVAPYQARVRAANAILHELADARDLAVVPLFAATNRLGVAALATHHARDLFHPNDRGYGVWARAFLGPASARVSELTGR
ncbi:SGNH/GDSL hydrolase family protein [Conexibacter sp. DBS9H8]|uniref:SGNH/GDSL hydrolase family protein n=1 Tax=Conexibacter sp. DBS9H8 TaxID=2937801 RepID=UPI00200BCD87|nr:SGNH/GDSL hydrolase family protein [Conexibacter sp. DBS9H8]